MDGECAIDNGIVPNMTSCRDFIICISGKVARRISCTQGLMFDVDIGVCNYEQSVKCGTRPKQGIEKCYTADVNVTLKVENQAVEPHFMLEISIVAPRQPLFNFLLMAAGKDNGFSFKTRQLEDYGEFVSSLNGLDGNEANFSGWVPSDRRNNQLIQGVYDFYPEDGEVITYKFFSFAGNMVALKNLVNIPIQFNRNPVK